jgi:putative ABC transport system permease protein
VIRQTIRSLVKSPGFTSASIVALALGIGANTAIFSLVNTVLLRPLPYKDPSRLVILWQNPPSGGVNSLSAADFQDWRDRNRSFEQMAALTGAAFNFTGGDRPEKVFGLQVSSTFFSTLGVTPSLGRGFLPEEEQPGAGRVVILSDDLWKRRFGGDPALIGKTIPINQQNYTVVGVMPPGFQFWIYESELWTQLTLDPNRADRSFYYLVAVARLKPHITLEQARAELTSIARQLALEYPKTNQGWGASIIPVRDELTGDARLPLLLLLGAVAFVLLIACANVANLLLVRAAGRYKEFAIRAALGAGRLDIIRRLLFESLLLATAGGLLGILLADWSIAALVALNPAGIPRLHEVAIDWNVLLFAVLVSLLTGILFGLAPAARISRLDVNDALKEGGRGASEGKRGHGTRDVLVIAEVVLAMVLLIGAGLMIRTFAALETARTGFPTENFLTMNFSVRPEQYSSEQQVSADFEHAVERVRSLPGIVSVASATNLPVGEWNQGRAFTIEGRPQKEGEILAAGYISVSPSYFGTVGLPLIRGREFTDRDRFGAPDVAIISESMARRFWPNENPIGKRIICASRTFRGRGLGTPIPREIVGVVGDVQHVGLESDLSTEMYVPQMQNTLPFTCLLVRTASDPHRLAQQVTRRVNEVLTDSPVTAVKTLDEAREVYFSRPRFQTVLLGVFAGLALLLAALGIYAVMAYSAAQRRHEIGIRMALGADARQVLALVLGHALKLALIGVVLGLAGAFASTRLMATLLYGVTPTDTITFAGVSALLLAVATLASLVPAWRAAKTDPASTLRSQL